MWDLFEKVALLSSAERFSRNLISTSATTLAGSRRGGEPLSRWREGKPQGDAAERAAGSRRGPRCEGAARRCHVLSSKHVVPPATTPTAAAGNTNILEGKEGHVTAMAAKTRTISRRRNLSIYLSIFKTKFCLIASIVFLT